MNKQEAAKVIALTLAELDGAIAPSVTHWGQAKVWAELFEQRGHITTEPIGYAVVDREGKAVRNFGLRREDAEAFATEYTKDCVAAGIDWEYRVAAITALEGK